MFGSFTSIIQGAMLAVIEYVYIYKAVAVECGSPHNSM